MTTHLRRLAALILLMLTACASGWSRKAPAATRHSRTEQILLLSDLHFNPFADPALAARLAQEPVAQWNAILAQSKPATLGRYGADTGIELLHSALAAMRARAPHPAAVLISGDFLAHGFDQAYQKAMPHGGKTGYQDFVNKTVAFVSRQLAATYPGVAIIPALGNNDSACGDYHIQPQGAFLQATARTWRPLVDPAAANPSFIRQFAQGGYYSLHLPVRHTRLLVLNNIYWSRSYANACGSSAADPGKTELTWLQHQLARARAHHEKVWLLGHIPPGIDAYSTLHRKGAPTCPASVVPMYAPAYASAYLSLLHAYGSTIALAVEGHTHMNDFRLDRTSATAGIPMQIVPAVSPIFGNNPGFIVWTVDRASGAVRNSVAWALTNFPAAGATPQWQPDSNFDQRYGQTGWNSTSLRQLEGRINTAPAVRASYAQAFNGGGKGGINAGNAHAYWCSLSHLSVSSYAACYCQQQAAAATTAKPAAH